MDVQIIREAQYGKEVREPIAGMLKNIIKNITPQDDSTTTEVKEAREQYPNLGDRINNIEQHIENSRKKVEEKQEIINGLFDMEEVE